MNCPKCCSPSPELHPAIQCGGEVEICVDDFHLRETPSNRYIQEVLDKKEALTRKDGANG